MEIEKVLNILAKQVGEVEIFRAKERTSTIEIKKGEIDLTREGISEGYGIRVIVGKRTGFAFSNQLDEAVIKRALDSAKIAEVDEHAGLPNMQSYKKAGDYDKNIDTLGSETFIEFSKDLVAPSKDYFVAPTTGSISTLVFEEEIVNSNGIEGTDSGTMITAYLSTVAKDTDIATGFYHESSRFLDLDFAKIGEEASRLSRSSLGAKRVETQKTDVILRPSAVTELLEHALMPSFSADNVQRGRSQLGGRVGEVIAGSVNLIDDGTSPSGLMSAKFDAEGVASGETRLIKDGELCGFLYDTHTGNKEGRKSTGNASRDSFSSAPQVAPTNVVISGKGEITKGLVVHGLIGAHTSNPVSGDFSCETRNAFLNGTPVKKAIISGNVFELLENVVGFGDDVKQFSHIVTPSIQFSDVTLVG